MTWSYDVATLATSSKDQVRRMIGDVQTGQQQLQDEEVNLSISQFSNIYLAAAQCCRWIAAQYSRDVDTVQGELRTLYSVRQRAYAARAGELQTLGMSRGAGAMPYAGGISGTDKQAQVDDPDRVWPQFNIGMDENLIPLGAGAGNQTPGNPAGGNSGDGA
jgi:hypothetical protein